ncbi:MAG: AEC family transporter [Rhodospirillaceae bacterium]|nr:AEC family transporter [Rhodospirillaceae bacterium]
MELIADIAAVVAPVFVISLIGFIWAKIKLPFDQAMVLQIIILVSTPCLVFVTLTSMAPPPGEIGRMGMAALICHIAFALAGWILLKIARLPMRVYLPSLMLPNSGNLGLSVSMFAFGETGMALAMIYMTAGMIGQFTAIPAIVAGRFDIRQLLKLPFIHALVIALAINLLDIKVPVWIDNTARLGGALCIPLALMSLGVAMAQLHIQNFRRTFLLSVFRVVSGGAIGWLIASALGLDGIYRGVLVIQSAMPSALFNYLFAQLNDAEPGEVASMVLVSTAFSYLTLPILVLLIR